MAPLLPPPDQVWSHGTNSYAEFSRAIQNETVTAIEADIVMGRDTSSTNNDSNVPVMAHPPSMESDLSAATFLDEATKSQDERRLSKHLKLDFKELDAVVPTLVKLHSLKVNNDGNIVYLNADILEGPGKSSVDVTVPADAFLQTCLELIASGVSTCRGVKVYFHDILFLVKPLFHVLILHDPLISAG
jgi:hypothetical protein